jgi:hypothetical protein
MDEAIAGFRDTIERANKAVGPDSIFAANAQHGIAHAARSHQPKVAVVAAREALRLFRALEGDQHPDTGRALDMLGKLLGDLGQRDEAIRTLTTAMAIRAAAFGDDHPDTGDTRFALAGLLYAKGERVRARSLAGSAHAAFVSSDPANAKIIKAWIDAHPP